MIVLIGALLFVVGCSVVTVKLDEGRARAYGPKWQVIAPASGAQHGVTVQVIVTGQRRGGLVGVKAAW